MGKLKQILGVPRANLKDYDYQCASIGLNFIFKGYFGKVNLPVEYACKVHKAIKSSQHDFACVANFVLISPILK